MTTRGTLASTTVELWDYLFAINVRAPFLLTQGAAEIMRREKISGSIVNIISVAAYCGLPHITAYSATKGALATFTKNCANGLLHDTIRVNGIMLVNVKKKPNYNSLSAEEKELLEKQLNMMIENKYSFLNYNGMRPNHLRALDPDKENPFDDKVIIVDEVHNFVSRIANKLKQPDSLSMKLYHYLMAANNARLVFLTGTPIINYPNELGILFNMLRGYIKTYSFR